MSKVNKQFIMTLDRGNEYQDKNVLAAAGGYKYFEFVFSELAPSSTEPNQKLAARFLYADGNAGCAAYYSSLLYGNDDGGNSAEAHNDSLLRLWPANRDGISGPNANSTGAVFGVMTLWPPTPTSRDAIYNAQIYGTAAWGAHGCQAWVSGNCIIVSPPPANDQPITGIEFSFYEHNKPYSANQIQSGSIDIYGAKIDAASTV